MPPPGRITEYAFDTPLAPPSQPPRIPQAPKSLTSQRKPSQTPKYGSVKPAASAAPPARNRASRVVLAAGALVVLVVVGALVTVVVRDSRSDADTIGAAPTSPLARIPTTTGPSSETSIARVPTGSDALAGNPIFSDPSARFATQECGPPGYPRNPAEGQEFYDFVVPCLDSVWRPLVTGVGLGFRGPDVLVPSGEVITSPCGTEDLSSSNTAAFYCGANETLYMPIQGTPPERYGNQPIIYMSVFAHEYGHHVQNVIGSLDEEVKREQRAGPQSAEGLEWSRRTELQAQCFSGMFIGSLIGGGRFDRDDYQAAYEDNTRGDTPGAPRTHGTQEHSQQWWDNGGREGAIGACNTWTAPSSDVE